uniref:Uncharacterized protein n=1 Tax=Octopus bimaculoides TaxID=37653 RepID=A0A0L8GSP3_OCTBM
MMDSSSHGCELEGTSIKHILIFKLASPFSRSALFNHGFGFDYRLCMLVAEQQSLLH